MKLKIVTYRDIFLWSERYKEDGWLDAAVVRLSPQDLADLGIAENGKLKLTSSEGSIVVDVLAEPKCPPGYGYMPVSPIINRLTTCRPGKLPNFKHIEVEAEAEVQEPESRSQEPK
ncbi:MAG: molybdopterin dinucleotide binding domain-containing protein [Syntrophales bacterium]|nr:molybdopterin dinucleotide binding domain-containing protein [Syntrophales bacterium]